MKNREKEKFVYGFAVSSYNKAYPLVIDPGLEYSTFLGGSSVDQGFGIAVDGSGNAYVTGMTDSSDFPTTFGAFDTGFNGGNWDAFVTKLSPSGAGASDLLYSTFLGGSSGEAGNGIAVDGSGNAYVTGGTQSSDFPTTAGAFDTSYNSVGGIGADIFVTKLNPTGTALDYSTFLGGSAGDSGDSIVVVGSGNVYVMGTTDSANFPTTAGAYDETHNGGYDAFVAKLSPSGAGASDLLYSTFLGGSSNDFGDGIAVDGSGNVYVTGRTSSGDFPTTSGAYDETYNGGIYTFYFGDVFVSKLNPAGTGASDLLYSTFLGGSNDEAGYDIAVDGSGNAYVTGWTKSTGFPTTAGAFDTSFNGGDKDAFVAKLSPAGTGASDLLYSTFLGGSGHDEGWGVAVDGSGNAFVTGYTNSSDFPTTAGAFDTGYNGGSNEWGWDAFVSKLSPSGAGASDLLYSTFLGGSSDDHGFGIAVDGSGNAYVTGATYGSGFPTTPGAYDEVNNDSQDAFVTKLSFNSPPDCSGAYPSLSVLQPPTNAPNHQMVSISILGVTDPDGDPVAITITGITQDEPVLGLGSGNTCPDGAGVGTSAAQVRAERAGTGNGRVYRISFTASDGKGGVSSSAVNICVPHNRGSGCIDDGQLYNSTTCP